MSKIDTTTDRRHVEGAAADDQLRLLAFTWGEPIEFHQVGEYGILEYHPWRSRDDSRGPDREKRQFHVWIGQSNTCHSEATLDAALALAIACKHEGPNAKAHIYFMRSLRPS